ncbi:hypothetical protein G6F20_002976 [Rhizopus arrhizus]|nr:hypothetical protein G6F20_002976 [Rhizopus arrhizus]
MQSLSEKILTKLSTFSSRASKIPHKLAQSSSSLLFSLRPSISTHVENKRTTQPHLPKTNPPRTTFDFTRLEQDKKTGSSEAHATCISSPCTTSSLSNSSDSSCLSIKDSPGNTLVEFIEHIEARCQSLLLAPHHRITQELIEDTQLLLTACELDDGFGRRLDALHPPALIDQVQEICRTCSGFQPKSYCIASDRFHKELPKIYKTRPTYPETDPVVLEAAWFRQHFLGKPYVTLIEPDFGMITIVQEKKKYRIIVRSKESSQTLCRLVSIRTAQETQHQLESSGHRRLIDPSRRSLLPFGHPSVESTRLMRAAILSVCPHLDLRSFKELSAESTSLAGLEKDLLRYDELAIPENYKFGLLNIKNGQTTEKAWLMNTGLSRNLHDFLTLLGHKVQLKGYQGYAGGLDTKMGEAGEFTFVSEWKEHEIAFHVAPMMPLTKNDDQQVLRKRYIGNDIVSIIFIEQDQPFDPKAILSNFVFVYIVIHPELYQGKRHWRIEVIKNEKITSFDPPLPMPPLLKDEELKSFLIQKLIRAESASLRSERLSTPNNKARRGLLNTFIKNGLDYFENNRRSRSLEKSSPHSSRLLQKAEQKLMTASSMDIVPLRSNSTRSLLSSFNKGFSRKKTQESLKRKSSKLNMMTSTEEEIDIFIGQDIQVSSESFISTEQLFASSLDEKEILQ